MKTYKCPFHKECVPPKDDYRCNIAYEHCAVFERLGGKKTEVTKELVDKLFQEDMRDY